MTSLRSKVVIVALVLAVMPAIAGCGSDCPPACGEGMVCVEGACVSACNPPCSEHQVCIAVTRTCQWDDGGDGDADADGDPDVGADADADGDADADDDGGADADADTDGDPDGDGDADTGPTLVDLVFLAENTGSFAMDRPNLAASIESLFAAYRTSAYDWDLNAASAHFGDFPIAPYGTAGTDVIFGVLRPIEPDLGDAAASMGTIPGLGGSDYPDGAVVALDMLATGAAFEPYWGGATCAGGAGAVCFRPGSRRVVLLFTNSTMHNGPPDPSPSPYDPGLFPAGVAPPPYEASVAALVAAGVRVIGIRALGMSDDPAIRAQLEVLAADSGSLVAGSPAVYDVNLRAGPADLGFLLDVIAELIR